MQIGKLFNFMQLVICILTRGLAARSAVCSEGADYENTFFSSYPTADKFMFTFEFLKDVSDDMV